eukprot:517992-Alexandrium_andersonii.AAC.1
MSASLVGSEMCIRDRGPLASSACVGLSSRRRRQNRGAAAGPKTPFLVICLLYTSDAADDM